MRRIVIATLVGIAGVMAVGGHGDDEAIAEAAPAEEATKSIAPTGTVRIGPRSQPASVERLKAGQGPREVPRGLRKVTVPDRPAVRESPPTVRGSATEPASRTARDSAASKARSSSANDLEIFRSTVVSRTRSYGALEPTATNDRNGILATGNLYVGVSDDNGLTFSENILDFSDGERGGGACCDQVAYSVDRGDYSLILWLIQDYPGELTGEGGGLRLRMFEGRGDLLAGKDTCDWVFDTPDFKLGKKKWFDFNQVSSTSKYLYITTNVRKSTQPYDDPLSHSRIGSLIFRIPLNDLDDGDCTVTPEYWDRDGELYISPVQNGGFNMHFATHVSKIGTGDVLRIYSIADSSNALESKDKNIDNFKDIEGKCRLDDGINPCRGQHDGRMSGFHSGNTIGWLWMADQDNSYPRPHVRVAVFEAGSKKKLVDHAIFSDSIAWQLPSVGVNEKGHLGVVLYAMGGSLFPSAQAFIRTDPTNWSGIQMTTIADSTSSGKATDPTKSDWGHYGSVRAYHGCEETFLGSVYTSHDGLPTGGGGEQKGRMVWFGKPGSGCEDLAMTSVTLGPGSGNRTYTLGDSIDVITNLQNQGSADSPSSRIGYYLSRDQIFNEPDIPFPTSHTTNALGPTENQRRKTTLSLPATPAVAMEFYVLACADDGDQIDEITVANNCAATRQTITVATAPDLVMMRVRVKTDDGDRSFVTGDTLDVLTVVQNQGSVLASASFIGYYLSSDQTLDDSDISFGTTRTANALDPGERHIFTAGLQVPPARGSAPRDFYVIACADDLKEIREISAGNNCAATEATITVSAPP